MPAHDLDRTPESNCCFDKVLKIACANQDVPASYSNLYNRGTANFYARTPIIIEVEPQGPPKGTVRLKPYFSPKYCLQHLLHVNR